MPGLLSKVFNELRNHQPVASPATIPDLALSVRPVGVAEAQAGYLAAAETGAGLLARALAGAQVTGNPRLTSHITPQWLGSVGRSLVLAGEALSAIQTDTGGVRLLPARTWSVWGDANPTNWLYDLHLAGPSGDYYRRVMAEGVIHGKYQTDHQTPWRGVSPLATYTSSLGAEVTALLQREAQSPHGYIWPLVWGATPDQRTETKERLDSLAHANRGGLEAVVIGDPAGGGNPMLGASEHRRGETSRIGMNPPSALATILETTHHQTLTALGIPPALFDATATGQREAWRTYLSATAQPVATLLADELTTKLETDITLDVSPSRSADEVTGRARAFKLLAGDNAELPTDQALTLAGF